MFRLVRPCLALALVALLGVPPVAAQRIRLPYKLPELEARAKADSNDAAAHYNLALGYWNEKRMTDAESSLRRAIAIEPRFAPAHLALAFLPFAQRPKLWEVLWEEKIPDDAAPALKQFDAEYRHAFLIDPLLDIRIMGAATPPKPDFLDVKDYLGEAWALFFQGFTDCQEGKYENCHGRFVTLIREIDGDRFPERVPNSVLWYKALAAAHIGKFDIAEQHYRQLMDRTRDAEKKVGRGELSRVPMALNEYRYTLATVLQAEGRIPDAVTLYREVLENDIGYYMAHVRLAGIYEAARDWPKAVQERVNAVNANPDDASLLTDLGVTLGKAGMMAQAETRFQAAIEANPRDVRPLFWLGLAQMDLGKKDAARESLNRFVAAAPSRYERQITMAREKLATLQ